MPVKGIGVGVTCGGSSGESSVEGGEVAEAAVLKALTRQDAPFALDDVPPTAVNWRVEKSIRVRNLRAFSVGKVS